jgi:predicted nucleotidyltransferase
MSQIKEALASYFMGKSEVVAAYLYGSYAQGTHHSKSDVDIAILLNNSVNSEAEIIRSRIHREVSRFLKRDPHVVLLDLTFLELVRRVLSTGALLCVNDDKMHNTFKYRAILGVAEFGYYRSDFQNAVVKQISGGSIGA